MPLLDHFHAPIERRHSWEAFYATWAVALDRELNRILPPRFLAEPLVHTAAYMAREGTCSKEVQVHVYDLDDRRLLAVIELVCPSHKHDETERRGFAGKCAANLNQGLGLIVVDIVTSRNANLHRELFDLLDQPTASSLVQTDLYATAYRSRHRGGLGHLDIWAEALAVGQVLPVLPLALRGEPVVPVNLEATYMEARQASRL
jgi:hypothetical protein